MMNKTEVQGDIMADKTVDVLRDQVLKSLQGGHAHVELEGAVKDFPERRINSRVDKVPYSCWQLLEHIRITQWDIVEFVLNPEHKSPDWPAGYWPKDSEKATPADWKKSIARFKKDRKRLVDLVADPKTDLTGDIPHAPGYTILREALLVVDHTAYHIGELVLMRRAIGSWTK
jgi:hypothetical protein